MLSGHVRIVTDKALPSTGIFLITSFKKQIIWIYFQEHHQKSNDLFFSTSCYLFVLPVRSHIGKAILSQPACVSKLLSLLLDQRPSPKLVLIILQLCRAALPLMSVEDCGNVELPPWSYSVPSLNSEQDDPSDPASKIASLLLAKLADYVVPGTSIFLVSC